MTFEPKEKGQGLFEYAIILVLIAMVVVVAVAALGNSVIDMYTQAVQPFL